MVIIHKGIKRRFKVWVLYGIMNEYSFNKTENFEKTV
ncbi:hypothetical protein QFZ31_006157 [Neobacillus niacini]|nr:hypothetical protein [Neobacillus niacini]